MRFRASCRRCGVPVPGLLIRFFRPFNTRAAFCAARTMDGLGRDSTRFDRPQEEATTRSRSQVERVQIHRVTEEARVVAWPARKNGVQRRRQWCKVLLAMDAATWDSVAVKITLNADGPSHGLPANHCRAIDSPVLPGLLDLIPKGDAISRVTADGAYDTRRCHTAIIPIRRNGRPRKGACPTALAGIEILRATRQCGGAIRKRGTGSHARRRAEAEMPSQVLSNPWRSPARPEGLRHSRDRSPSLKPMGSAEVMPHA